MGSLFQRPKIVKPEPAKPLPREDDEAARQERIKSYAALQKSGGRESTRLGEQRLGDYSSDTAMTRGAAILGG